MEFAKLLHMLLSIYETLFRDMHMGLLLLYILDYNNKLDLIWQFALKFK